MPHRHTDQNNPNKGIGRQAVRGGGGGGVGGGGVATRVRRIYENRREGYR